MSSLVFVLATLALVLPAALAPAFRWVAPKHSAFFTASILAMGLALLEVGLILTALPTVLRAARLRALAALCEQLLGHASPANIAVGWIAAGLAVGLGVTMLRSISHNRAVTRQLRIEPWVGAHETLDSYELVVLPSDETFAFSLPGPIPQVIVSQVLVSELSAAEFRAVVRHEKAHLDLNHGRWMMVGAVTQAALGRIPIVQSSVQVLTLSLERWADEASTTRTDDRVALFEALRTVVTTLAHPAVAPFSRAETVAERLDALRDPSPNSRALGFALFATVVLLLGAAVGSVGDWIGHAHSLVTAVPFCPV